MSKTASILFPHQLFKDSPVIEEGIPVYLVEEYLFFGQYKFHKQKILFHRATMKAYEDYLTRKGFEVRYIEGTKKHSDVRKLIPWLVDEGFDALLIIDPTDNWLEKRIRSFEGKIDIQWFENPLFINTKEELSSFFKPSKKKFFQTAFYKEQRKKRNILMNNGTPEGGKWTYDTENRKKYPKGKAPPMVHYPEFGNYNKEAKTYVEQYYNGNYGALESSITYPVTFRDAEDWFYQFLQFRFHDFGVYEDAIVASESILNHSLLSPLINVGLLHPMWVIERTVLFAEENKIPINSTEGLVRQIIGWREFIRGVYEVKGTEERNRNFWGFTRRIPKTFYTGDTGIPPIDTTIKKIQKTAYAHHIERLMILGNFMVLCEFDPDEVYQWFMELFIDAYDWVMVTNVYGMSLYADGGLMSTKPYISSSNYLMKMGDYAKGDWQQTWDGLFWNFMDKHRDFFLSNPRLGMLIRTWDKMDSEKRTQHLQNAASFFKTLDTHA
ncbi:cryptochrome/photolyase family protein [Aureisphaera galaxeae]|uniref:cryptochrome/photolyase family protein n=1 Tax=Aureisphaera galaxeae TaxID=1538023 RepID=UPI0023506BAA|nr:cryptochrome/photolyase family protein [Aureisphaera galaxeae]MDC8006179.1 cryptochrome/photolyase family protein [Aureisphaera galaxeae]